MHQWLQTQLKAFCSDYIRIVWVTGWNAVKNELISYKIKVYVTSVWLFFLKFRTTLPLQFILTLYLLCQVAVYFAMFNIYIKIKIDFTTTYCFEK